MMPIGSRKDARKMGLAFSLPWNFAEGCRLDITEPEVSEALSQGLPEVALMRILAQVDGQLRDRRTQDHAKLLGHRIRKELPTIRSLGLGEIPKTPGHPPRFCAVWMTERATKLRDMT